MITQIAIEEALIDEGRRLRGLVERIRDAAMAEAQAETAYKVAFARERITARMGEGRITEASADDHATVFTEAERLAYLTAEATLLALREERNISSARIDALRTLMASLRSVT